MHARQTSRRLKTIAIAVLAPLTIAAALAIHPQIVFAGTYTVHTCQTPSGRFTGNGGWASDTGIVSAGYDGGSTELRFPGSGSVASIRLVRVAGQCGQLAQLGLRGT